MATAQVHDGPMNPGGMHHGWHDKWSHFKEDVKHTPRTVLAAFTAGSAILSLGGGVLIGRDFFSEANAAGTPDGQPGGGVAIGTPNVKTPTPAPSSGGFVNKHPWVAECFSVTGKLAQNGETNVIPKFQTSSGGDPEHTYLVVSYGVDEGDQIATRYTVAQRNVSAISIPTNWTKMKGFVYTALVNFPNPDHQPTDMSIFNIDTGGVGADFPEAEVVACPEYDATHFAPNQPN